MSLILKQLFTLVKLLNSDTGSNQLASGVAAGFILGMTPQFSLQTVLVFIAIFFFRVQAGMAFLSAFVFAFIAYLLDPVFHTIGSIVLTQPSLEPIFTKLYNMPIVPLTKFNNSVVMGAGIVAIALSPLVFIVAKIMIRKYRHAVVERFRNSKAWKAIQATGLYKWYYKYNQFYG